MEIDRVKGGLIALALGDALGLPHEFSYSNNIYTGVLEYRFEMKRKYGLASITMGLGQYSDDTEMSLALIRCLIENKGWNQEKVALAYMNWANSAISIGHNTRALFKGVKTFNGYNSRYEKLFHMKVGEFPYNTFGENNQSNGSLMRCFGLACLWDENVAQKDCSLTNPSSVSVDINLSYTNMIRMALVGDTPINIWNSAKNYNVLTRQIATEIENNSNRNLAKSKGWVVNSFYCVMKCLYMLVCNPNLQFSEIMRWVIAENPGSDTDTNASITGALIGSIFGYNKLITEEITKNNINIMLSDNPTENTRPDIYKLKDIDQICKKLVELRFL